MSTSRSSFTVALTLVVSCAGFLDQSAAAQSVLPNPITEVRQSAKRRLGPLYVTPTLELRDFGVDSNVFNSPVDPKADFTATLVPKANIWIPMRQRALVSTAVGAGLVYYHSFANQRSIDPDLSARAEVITRRIRFFAEDRYLSTRQRLNLEIDARARRSENAAAAGAVVALGVRMTVDFVAYHRQLRYNHDDLFLGTSLRDALSHKESGLRLAMRYPLTSLTTLTFRAETLRTRFDFSPRRDADGFRVTSGFEFKPRALIGGSADVGVRRFATRDSTLPDFTGVVAKTSLTYTFLQATRLSFAWNRDLGYSFELNNPYYVENAFSGRLRRQILGRIDGIVGADRATYNYRSFGTVESFAARRDVTVSFSLDIGYRLNRDLRAGLVVSNWRRTSRPDSLRGYRATRVGLSVLVTVPG